MLQLFDTEGTSSKHSPRVRKVNEPANQEPGHIQEGVFYEGIRNVRERQQGRSNPEDGVQAVRTPACNCDSNGNKKEGQRELHTHCPALN